MFLILLAATHILGAETLDLDMDSMERKKTGVYKLTSKEKAALQGWIDTHYEKRESSSSHEKERQAILSENLNNGKYIRLSDGSLWEIAPEDMPISQAWITPVKIIVSRTKNTQYPYKLTNTLTGSSLRARKANETPDN